MTEEKCCSKCHKTQPLENFWVRKRGKQSGRIFSWCKTCVITYSRDWKHRTGRQQSMKTNRDCSAFLGVNIAERILSRFFDDIQRMPYKNKGFDFICGRGFKIDVKSGCITRSKHRQPYWFFGIKRNKIADYFLCLAFDSRENLNPLHVWLIPNAVVCGKMNIKISNTVESLEKWKMHERSLNKVITCCNAIKEPHA